MIRENEQNEQNELLILRPNLHRIWPLFPKAEILLLLMIQSKLEAILDIWIQPNRAKRDEVSKLLGCWRTTVGGYIYRRAKFDHPGFFLQTKTGILYSRDTIAASQLSIVIILQPVTALSAALPTT